MRLVILATRTYTTMLTIENIDTSLKKLKLKPTEVLGLDSESLGCAWAEQRDIPFKEFPIKWDDVSTCKTVKTNRWGKPYNPRAGFERNTEMLKGSDGVLAFWDDEEASQTEQIITEAKKMGLPIYFIKPNPEYVVE